MTRMSGAKAIEESLLKEGTKVIFGIPGGSTLPLYDVLYDSKIRHILAHHEQCAAHMADGYARASGTPGVCLATSGPGATNLVTGVATANIDSSPIIALTGQVATPIIGKDCVQLRDPSEIPKSFQKAFYIATTGRPGPVLIDLPKDVLVKEAEMNFEGELELRGYKPKTDPHPVQVKRAVEMLINAERPMMLVGGGAILSGASEEVLLLAEILMSPVGITLMGKGAFPETHPLSVGVVGMHGTTEANRLIVEADVLLAVGCRFTDRTTCRLDQFCPDAKIIHIDIDSVEIGKNAKVDLPIVADAKKTLRQIYAQLSERLAKRENSTWTRRINEIRDQFKPNNNNHVEGPFIRPKVILSELRKILPNNTIVTTEVGQNQSWSGLYFPALEPRTFITSGGLGTMGFGFPAALGAKVACPDVQVVDIAGDGSFTMTEQDLATSVNEQIPVVVVVLNNSVLGMVAQWQRLFYNRRYSGIDLKGVPDFVKLADAYGVNGVRVENLAEFSTAITKALRSEVTTVVDVPISPEENVFPMVPSGSSLKEMMME
jgi:acetolactate synthase-1/2/3 large subunit